MAALRRDVMRGFAMSVSKKAYVKSVLRRRKYERRERIKNRIIMIAQVFAICAMSECMMIMFVLAA